MKLGIEVELSDRKSLLYFYKKMGILGGTFNPVHNGHIDMALNIRQEFGLASVLFIPAANPPHKQDVEDIAPADARLKMAALAVMEHAGLSVSNIEVEREGLSYTIDTMRELSRRYGEVEFYFIIGSDSLFSLESWKHFRELCRMMRFVCVRRQEHDRLSIMAQAAKLGETYDAVIEISDYNGLFVSSSYIRKRVAQGKDIGEFVPAAVEEYIHASGLYKQQG